MGFTRTKIGTKPCIPNSPLPYPAPRTQTNAQEPEFPYFPLAALCTLWGITGHGPSPIFSLIFTMQIQVSYGEIEKSDFIEGFINEKVERSVQHFPDRVTRVEVHLHNDSGTTSTTGRTKRCTMEARPSGQSPIAVEDHADTIKQAISNASHKLERILKKTFDKGR
jgi:ribosomal subunit interface protein